MDATKPPAALDTDTLIDEILAKKGPHKYKEGLSEDNWEEVLTLHAIHSPSHICLPHRKSNRFPYSCPNVLTSLIQNVRLPLPRFNNSSTRMPRPQVRWCLIPVHVVSLLVYHEFTRVNGSFSHKSCPCPSDRANAYKEEGNYLFKQKKYKEATAAYSEAIRQKCEDPATNAILYCNRAAVEYHLGEL